MQPISKKVLFPGLKEAARWCAVLLALLVCSIPAFSQGALGTIQGGVFDSAGGAIAGAKVTVLDVARGVSRTLMTDESGQYVAPALTAGTYTVRGEATGFSVVERSNVLLQVSANVRVDLTLSPGAQTQTITVTEEIPAIDPTSATLGGNVTNETILSLPLNGRNFLELLQLRPGVVDLPGANNTASSTNGRRQGADVLLIEGVTQFDLATSNVLINGANNGAPGATLPIDAIQDFNAQQNAPAEYGWRDGSVINVGVKSGTNALHGTAYAFGRDAAKTDASNYFTGQKTNLEREQFGATAGGPIIKDKLFWFLGYEGVRQRSFSSGSITIPGTVAGAGPTNSIVDACNAIKAAAPPNNVISPLSAQLAGLNIGTCAVTPESATTENIFRDNPTTSTTVNSGTRNISPENNGLAKVDWNLTERNHLNGLFFIAKGAADSEGSVKPYWGSHTSGTVYQYSGSWTWTPSSNWVNDFRVGSASSRGSEVTGDNSRLPSDPYPAGYSFNTGVTNPKFGGFPCVHITSFQDLGNCGKPGQRGPQGQLNFRDSISYLRGNHAFKFGGELVLVKFDNESLANVVGTVTFDTLQNYLTGTPSASANNILGGNTKYGLRERWYSAFVGDTWRIHPRLTLTPGVRYEYMGPPHEIDNHLGTFDPTVTGGITVVGPGLPHEKLFNPEKYNFSPRLGVAWDILGNGRTVLRGGVSRLSSFPSITAFNQAVPFGSNLINGSGVTVVSHTGDPISQASSFTVPYTGSQLAWNTTGPLFPGIGATGAAPCGDGIFDPDGAGPLKPVSQCQTGAPDPNFKYPKSLQWNVDLQRAITNNLTLDVAYVANHGYDESLTIDVNAVPVGTGWTPAVISACAAAATNSAASRSACVPSQTAITNARPYNAQFPWLSYISRPTSGFRSNYNALQATLDGRNYHGLSFLASYTYAHALDSWSRSSQVSPFPVDPTNYNYQYGNGDRDIRHRLRLSPRYRIPGIKTPGQMLEGWTLSTIVSIQGGFAWGPVDATRNDWAGNGENANANATPNNGVWQTWNYYGDRSAFNSNAREGNNMPCLGRLNGCDTRITFASPPSASIDPTGALATAQQACIAAAQAPYVGNPTQMTLALKALGNNACYIRDGGILTPPAYGTLGNSGRNPFRGPGYTNVDMTLGKDWHITERYSAEMRIEVFNIFNTPSFALPSNNPTSGLTGRFGFTNSTAADSRRMQFGLKLGF